MYFPIGLAEDAKRGRFFFLQMRWKKVCLSSSDDPHFHMKTIFEAGCHDWPRLEQTKKKTFPLVVGQMSTPLYTFPQALALLFPFLPPTQTLSRDRDFPLMYESEFSSSTTLWRNGNGSGHYGHHPRPGNGMPVPPHLLGKRIIPLSQYSSKRPFRP